MATATQDKVWMGKTYLEIESYGTGRSVSAQGVIDRNSLSIKLPDREVKNIPLLNEGNLYAVDQPGMYEVSFDMYCRSGDYADGSLEKLFFGADAADATSATISYSSLTENAIMCRTTLCFTNITNLADASAALTTSSTAEARRYVFADCFITTYSAERSDNMWKISVSLKGASSDADAGTNVILQYLKAGGTTIAALGAYTSVNKF